MQWVAIDPGLDGGLLAFDGVGGWIFDPMPINVTKSIQPRSRATGKKRAPRVRRTLDTRRAAAWLAARPGHVILENQHPIKGQGLTSTGSIMQQFGLLEGILCGLQRPYNLIDAIRWQKVMRVVGVKASSWIVMQRAQPDLAQQVQQHREATRVACADCWCMIQATMRDGAQADAVDDWLS